MDFRINDLFNFLKASECSSFTEAANLLNISQPALSESIKNLENDLEQMLFYRSKNGIQLTPSGKLYAKKAAEIINSIDNFSKLSKNESLFSHKTIQVGCHATVAQYTLPIFFKKIFALDRNLNIKIHHGLSREIQQKVQNGIIDIGIVINPTMVPDLIINKLSTDQFSIWHSKKVLDSKIIFCNTELIQTQSILKKLKLKNYKIIETTSLELIARFVEEGNGLGILPRRVLEMYNLNFYQLEHSPTFVDEISIIYRPELKNTYPENLIIENLRLLFK